MYKIRFSEDRSGDGYDFKAGQTYDLSHASCHRWVRRGVAVYVGTKPPDSDPHVTNAPRAPEAKSKIRFSEDRTGEDYSFKAGHEYSLPLSSCKRWVRRGVAQYVGPAPVEAAVIPHEPKAPVPDLIPEEPKKKTGKHK